jgi:hypothetical protein
MILTIADVKEKLKITDTSKDSEILKLVLKVNDMIIQETRNYFFDSKTSAIEDSVIFSATSKTITLTNAIDIYFEDIFIISSKKNSGFFKVLNIENNVITVEDDLKDETAKVIIRKVVFDNNVKDIALSMCEDSMTKTISDVKSESSEGYSVTFRDLNEYFESYKKKLRVYKKVRSIE